MDETYEKSARDETIEQEIRDLEDSRTADKTQEEVTAIEAEIKVKIEELEALPPEVIDNTIYWEGYYGKGGLCKRTSYNTIGQSGGSGIVILRYPNTFTITVGSGLTSSTATDGSDKVTSFTAGTDSISFS